MPKLSGMTAKQHGLVPYAGGKYFLVPFLLKHIPYALKYVEPFFGMGAYFFNRKPSDIEVINDINQDVINLFRTLQNPITSEKLLHRLHYTLYSTDELMLAIETLKTSMDSLERAWAYIVCLGQGFCGRVAKSIGYWGRSHCDHGRSKPITWKAKIDKMDFYIERLRSVYVENRDAKEVIKYWDDSNTVFYLDPPYVLDTRKDYQVYQNEMTNDDHVKLLETCLACQGAIAISGYSHEIYDDMLANWTRVEKSHFCNMTGATSTFLKGAKMNRKKDHARTEVLWLNPRCIELQSQPSISFDILGK